MHFDCDGLRGPLQISKLRLHMFILGNQTNNLQGLWVAPLSVALDAKGPPIMMYTWDVQNLGNKG